MSGRGRARRAVVLIDHGSRERAANRQLATIAAALARRLPAQRIATAHLTLLGPSLEEAVARCAAAGATEIVVTPCFLAPGRHATRDVPRLARAAARRHPGVHIRVARAIGAHPGLVAALAGRIREATRGPGRSASRTGSRSRSRGCSRSG